jgi:hypothetical protein
MALTRLLGLFKKTDFLLDVRVHLTTKKMDDISPMPAESLGDCACALNQLESLKNYSVCEDVPQNGHRKE